MPRTNLLTAHPHHRVRRVHPDVAAPGLSDWDGISTLVADGDLRGRALLGDDPALGPAGGAHAYLLIEVAEPLMVRQPLTGRIDELQVELLILRGFSRYLPGADVPAPSSRWVLDHRAAGLELRDAAGNLWARVPADPDPEWLAAAGRDGHVVVLYGAWLGVRTPSGVRDSQYGPAQRAAELRAARPRGHVAVAAVPWRA
ncbi:hypothetical protein HC028_16940 [Planosporangium flavigriseum]|uniref:Uncharacterized protein n=1 Tax=Planosporangium flavigriseum TaxID=373681 RepID=A0A8J3LWK2_9ACTN|nr:hypothetical protein [Planosporangium flavigriseum]NJC66179.1 hypothetical protein [Planosporangium flavigriseum]GIG75129.1 hypothetical protein Pfl04_35330 [Planosporangium flavigriseum]